jgi:hypothetical protein
MSDAHIKHDWRTAVQILGALLLLPLTASAGWISRSGQAMPDTDASKSVGTFAAQMVLVADERELLKNWRTPSESVDVHTIDKVATNGLINAFVVFGGCKADTDGNCRVVMRFRVLKPDGGVYAETPEMEVWTDKPAPPGHSIELSVDYLKIRIEPTDQVGRYIIQTQVKDENAATEIQLKSPFVASNPLRRRHNS